MGEVLEVAQEQDVEVKVIPSVLREDENAKDVGPVRLHLLIQQGRLLQPGARSFRRGVIPFHRHAREQRFEVTIRFVSFKALT